MENHVHIHVEAKGLPWELSSGPLLPSFETKSHISLEFISYAILAA